MTTRFFYFDAVLCVEQADWLLLLIDPLSAWNDAAFGAVKHSIATPFRVSAIIFGL